MNHHITLKLANADDFKQLVTVIEGAGYRLLSLDYQVLEMECKVDSLILQLAERYLDADVVYHKTPAVIIKDSLSRSPKFSNATG